MTRASISSPSAGQVAAQLPAVVYRANGTDDSANIATLLANGSRAVQLADGQAFAAATAIIFPGDRPATVIGSQGGTFTSTIPNTGPMSSIFSAGGDVGSVNSGTLHATPALGARTVQVDATLKPVVGNWLVLSHGVSAQVFKVQSVTGSTSPYTVTICDTNGNGEPLALAFASGDPVEEFAARPEGITVDGRGMLLTGSGNQLVEFVHGLRCVFRDLQMRPSSSTSGLGFDVGGRENLAERVFVSIPGSGAQVGLYMQSNDRSVFRECRSTGAQYGLSMLDCFQSGFTDCWAYECSRGIVAGSLPLDTTASLGNFGCWIRGGGAVGCDVGLDVFGSSGLTVSDFEARACTQGILVESSSDVAHTPTTTGTVIRSCRTTKCGVGVYVTASAVGTVVRDLDATGCTTAALQAAGPVSVDGLTASALGSAGAGVATAISLSAASKLTNVTLDNTGASGSIAIQWNASGTLRDSTVSVLDLALYVVAGTVRFDRVTVAAGSRGVSVANGATAVIGPGCDFSAATTPIEIAAGGTVHFEQGNGIAAVSSTRSLTFGEHYCTAIELASGAGADSTITTYAIPGMAWDLSNPSAHNLILKTSTADTVTVAAGKRARVVVDGAGKMRRESADA